MAGIDFLRPQMEDALRTCAACPNAGDVLRAVPANRMVLRHATRSPSDTGKTNPGADVGTRIIPTHPPTLKRRIKCPRIGVSWGIPSPFSGPACGARPPGLVRHGAGSTVNAPCRAPQAGPLN